MAAGCPQEEIGSGLIKSEPINIRLDTFKISFRSVRYRPKDIGKEDTHHQEVSSSHTAQREASDSNSTGKNVMTLFLFLTQ